MGEKAKKMFRVNARRLHKIAFTIMIFSIVFTAVSQEETSEPFKTFSVEHICTLKSLHGEILKTFQGFPGHSCLGRLNI